MAKKKGTVVKIEGNSVINKKKGEISTLIPHDQSSWEYAEGLSRQRKIKKNDVVKTSIVAANPEFIPEYKTTGAACCDLRANIPPDLNGQKTLRLMPGHTQLIDCGIRIGLPKGYEAQIRAKSGWASKGVICTNASDEQEGGTIDDDYRDEIKVILTNVSKNIIVINHMDRIAQMSVRPIWKFEFSPVEQLENANSNRTGGIGSTGIT